MFLILAQGLILFLGQYFPIHSLGSKECIVKYDLCWYLCWYHPCCKWISRNTSLKMSIDSVKILVSITSLIGVQQRLWTQNRQEIRRPPEVQILPMNTKSLFVSIFIGSCVVLGLPSEKKTGLCGKNSQVADPHPPSLGNPCYQKKKLGLFFILGPQEHFWSSPKNHHFGW